MTVKVIVNGAKGRMGSMAVQVIQNDVDLALVGEADHQSPLAQMIQNTQADVVVDLTVASAVKQNAETIIMAGARPVIGTSGLQATSVASLKQLCEKQGMGGIIVPNFSIGAVLMMQAAQRFAEQFAAAEIIEMHHDKKQDAPSGTAIRTAEMIQEARKAKPSVKASQESLPGARGALLADTPIHSVRLPGLVAHQSVLFGGEGETLTITHDTLDRSCFMPGILLACKKVMALNTLVYGLEHIL